MIWIFIVEDLNLSYSSSVLIPIDFIPRSYSSFSLSFWPYVQNLIGRQQANSRSEVPAAEDIQLGLLAGQPGAGFRKHPSFFGRWACFALSCRSGTVARSGVMCEFADGTTSFVFLIILTSSSEQRLTCLSLGKICPSAFTNGYWNASNWS